MKKSSSMVGLGLGNGGCGWWMKRAIFAVQEQTHYPVSSLVSVDHGSCGGLGDSLGELRRGIQPHSCHDP